MDLLDLGIEQTRSGSPDGFGLSGLLKPLTEVGGEGVEVEVEAITTEHWYVRRCQRLTDLMDEVMGQVLGARTECEGRDELGLGIEGDPQPQVVSGLSGSGEEFVELGVSEVQAVTEVSVQALGVKPSAREPQALSRLANAEDALQGIGGDAFGEQREDEADNLGRGTEAIEGGVTAGREFAVASLTAQIGNMVVAVGPVAHQGMHLRIGNQTVGALGIAAGVAFGVDRLLAAAGTFDGGPGWRRGIGRT